MRPNVFVSSRIQDLHHLRDSIRDRLIELGLNPVMSERGDIGYLPNVSVKESCYLAVQQCQIAIVVIGKSYGLPDGSGVSTTHNEYRKAKDAGIPIFVLLDHEVESFRSVYLINRDNPPDFPGMDDPRRTFEFIEEIVSQSENNFYLVYDTTQSALEQITKQIAWLFGELLAVGYGRQRNTLDEVLAEIKAQRLDLQKVGTAADTNKHKRYLAVYKAMVDKKNAAFANILKEIFGDVESAVPAMEACDTFDALVMNAGWKIIEQPTQNLYDYVRHDNIVSWRQFRMERQNEMPLSDVRIGTFVTNQKKQLALDEETRAYFRLLFLKMKAILG